MMPTFLKLALAISTVVAVFHSVCEKGAYFLRSDVEAIGSISLGDRSIRVVLLLSVFHGQLNSFAWRSLSPGCFSHVEEQPAAIGRTHNIEDY